LKFEHRENSWISEFGFWKFLRLFWEIGEILAEFGLVPEPFWIALSILLRYS